MRPGNLMRGDVTPIRCMTCYDLGEVIDRFDHSKRERCHCQKGVTVNEAWQAFNYAREQHMQQYKKENADISE